MNKSTQRSQETPQADAQIAAPLERQKSLLKTLSTPPERDYFKETIFKGGSFKEQLLSHRFEPKRALFGEFWKERELAVLAGQTGIGKSALAMQIAIQIARGASLDSLLEDGTQVETPAQTVLFLDCEMDLDDWQNRLRGATIPENLLRFEFDIDAKVEGDLAQALVSNFKALIDRTGSKVLIIDNISWLFSDLPGRDIHAETSALMKLLLQLRKSEGVAILVVAHTLKGKKNTPFTLEDVAGSSNLQRYLESCFSIAEVQGQESHRYLKQLKSRGRKKKYTSREVAVCELLESEGVLQLMRREDLDTRENLLLTEERDSKDEIEALLLEGEKSASEIAQELEVSRQYVYKIRKELKDKQEKQ